MWVGFGSEADEECNIDDGDILIYSWEYNGFSESFIELYLMFIIITVFVYVLEELFDELEAIGADCIYVVYYWIFLFFRVISKGD